jgi:hypothetical protein
MFSQPTQTAVLEQQRRDYGVGIEYHPHRDLPRA